MKRTGFKQKTYEEKIAILKKRQEKAREKAKNKPRKIKKTVKKRKVKKVKLNKNGTKPKSERVRLLKNKLWRVFSQYIRLSYANEHGYVHTCDGSYVHWKECHCGHLFHNSERNRLLGGNELWFYENNFAPQSAEGNTYNKDDSAKKYTIWAIDKYGMDEVKKMERIRHVPRKFTEQELNDKYTFYKQAVEKLISEKC